MTTQAFGKAFPSTQGTNLKECRCPTAQQREETLAREEADKVIKP